MGRLITIGIILTAILGLSLGGLNYARGLRDEFDAETLRGQAACRQKDAAALEKTAAELQSLWEKREGFLSFYVHHDDLDRLEMGLVSLSAHIENESFENAFSALEQLRFQASHIYQRELPGWNNLF